MHRPAQVIVCRGALALLLLLGACGGGSGGGTTEEATSNEPVATDSTDTSTGGSESTAKAQRIRVERPSGTPLGEVIPPGDDAYLLLSTGRCGDLLKRTSTWRRGENPVNEDAYLLYRAAAEACVQSWDAASRDFDRLTALDPSFDGDCDSTNCEQCMRAVLAWLRSVLAARKSDPDVEVQYVQGTASSPCPEGRGTPDDEQTTTTEDATTTSRRGGTSSRASTTSAP